MTGRRLAQLAAIPVGELNGVGDKKVDALAAMGIETVLDLLTHYPRRYVDRTRQSDIADLKVGDEAVVLATVKRVKSRRTRQGRMIVEVDVFDGTSYLHVVFFNQGWRAKQLGAGTQAVFFGKLERFRDRRQMTNPIVDLVGDRTGRIVPIYPQSKKEGGLHTWELAGFIEEALARAGPFADPLPEAWLDRLDLVDRRTAFTAIHNPDSMETAKAARRRLVLDELLRMQVALVLRKRAIERESKGIRHVVEGGLLVPKFHAGLPFALTGAQTAGHRRDRGRPGRSPSHAPPAPGRRGQRQDGRGPHRPAHRRPGRLPGGVHGPHRGAGRAARRQPAPPAGRADRPRRAHAHRRPPAAGGAALQPHDGRRADPDPGRRWPRATSTCWSAPTPCSRSGWRSRPWA